MENLFNYLTYLTKYFNLLIETEETGQLMKQEVGNYQRNRYLQLLNECGKVYDNLFLTFDNYLIELGNEVTIEIFRRDNKGQELLYAQLRNIINEFANKFNARYVEHGFSEDLIGTKFAKVKVERADGTQEEESIKYHFSIFMLAGDLSDKFNQLQNLIDERFKFLKPKKDTSDKKNGSGKLNGRSIALFCSIINESGLISKGMDSNEIYCNKIISEFKINAPVKTRQYFRETMELRRSDKYLKEVMEKILPEIPLEISEKIITYINSKLLLQDNKKLYG